MKNISLGQYYSVDSPIHRIDPRVKIVLAILYIVIVFLSSNIISMALLLLSAFVIMMLSNIPIKIILRSVKMLMFIIIFTAIINVFWTVGEGAPLLDLGFTKIYIEGIVNALFLIVRILVLIIGSSVLLTYTTTPIAKREIATANLSSLKKYSNVVKANNRINII